MRQLGGVDSMLTGAETASTFLHVIGVMTLDVSGMRGGDPREHIRALVSERIPVLEPFRWRLVETPGGLAAPHWIHDPAFDLDRHIRLATLPNPGSVAELERYVGDVAGTPLNRDRPLWEMHLVDGLADGQVAVVAKLHHAFMDGGAGVEIMASLFDLDPETDTPAPEDHWEPEAIPSGWSLFAAAPAAALKNVRQIPGVARRTVTGMGGLVGTMFPTGSGDPRSYLAPRTPYNGALSPRRVVALADYSLSDVKRVKAAFGTTVNDVVLAAVASSLRADLVAMGRLEAIGSRSVVVAVPVSMRPPDLERDFGNQTSMMMVPLPTHIEDPIERLHLIHEQALQIKDRHRAMGGNLIEDLAGMLPPWAISAGSRTADRLGLTRLMPPPVQPHRFEPPGATDPAVPGRGRGDRHLPAGSSHARHRPQHHRDRQPRSTAHRTHRRPDSGRTSGRTRGRVECGVRRTAVVDPEAQIDRHTEAVPILDNDEICEVTSASRHVEPRNTGGPERTCPACETCKHG